LGGASTPSGSSARHAWQRCDPSEAGADSHQTHSPEEMRSAASWNRLGVLMAGFLPGAGVCGIDGLRYPIPVLG